MHASSEHLPETDNGSLFTDLPWLRRTLAFLVLGPLLQIFLLLAYEAVFGGFGGLLPLIMGVVFVFGLFASVVTGIMDGMLSRSLPVSLRAPLAALSGAVLAVGPPAALLGPMPLEPSIAVGAGGAFCMGVCALLSYNRRHSHPKG